MIGYSIASLPRTASELCGAGGGSRTRVMALGRPHNSRYTTPAYLTEDNIFKLEPPTRIELVTYALRVRRSTN